MLSPTVCLLLQLRIKFLGNYTRSDLCRQNFQGGVSSDWLDRMTHFKRWQRKPKHFSVGASSRRKYELLQIVKSVKQPDDWHGKGCLGKSLLHWIWNCYYWGYLIFLIYDIFNDTRFFSRTEKTSGQFKKSNSEPPQHLKLLLDNYMLWPDN